MTPIISLDFFSLMISINADSHNFGSYIRRSFLGLKLCLFDT